jgi:class 3 adenylate cyclase/pimeloyl-ACP methyl ester carboxylesterase
MAVQRRLSAILSADVVGYSRLVHHDEAGTIAALQGLLKNMVKPTLERFDGRVVKLMGDGLLAEFPSVIDAAEFAIEIQNAMNNGARPEIDGEPLEYRIGINLGDVVVEGDDIHGDGVNVAARLEASAPAGGINISDTVFQSIRGKIAVNFTDSGEQILKNIDTPIRVWRWSPVKQIDKGTSTSGKPLTQEIRFCSTADGTNIAYATVGDGPPLVKAPNWMNHLEYDWESPIWRHVLQEFASHHTLLRFDQRCNGLSDWAVDSVTFDDMVEDMATVIDAAGLECFPLFGISQGCAFSIAYALRYPGRVERLVLYGGFAQGNRTRGAGGDEQEADLQLDMMRKGWGQNNPAFRQFFTSLFVPGASKDQMDWFNELQRKTVSAENAVRLREVVFNIDVLELAKQITIPTLVLHCRDDGIVPYNAGRQMAAAIPGARFIPLEGQNHLILEDEPAWPKFVQEVEDFLAEAGS